MEIGIAGAGLCGRLLAWQLLRAGHAVTLFDRDGGGEASAGFIAAAMLAPFSEAVSVGTEVLVPGLVALQQWDGWLQQLAVDSGGAHVPFERSGSVVVAHGNDRPELHWFHRRLQAMAGVASEHSQWLSRAQLTALEGDLQEFAEGVFLPLEGWLDNRALYRALHLAIGTLGGRWRCGEEVDAVDSGRIRTANSSGESVADHHFDLALDCRGFGAKAQLENFRGVRGEVLRVRAPEVNLSRPVRLMHPRYQLYVVPRPDNIYVIGATEIESESMGPVTVRSSLELLSALYTINSGFAEAELLEARAHCRPAFADNLPRIVQREQLLQVNGLYRHGFLLAPALVNSVLTVLGGGEVCSPIRFDQCNQAQGESYPREASA